MATEPRQACVGMLRRELAVDHARWVRMATMTGCATFLATVFLVFRVPLPAYGAYVVLMASQRDLVTSITVSIGALGSVVVAMAFSILLYILDIDEPALRVPAMAVVMFGAMYFSRLPRIGPVVFLSGFLLVVSQTLVDQIPDSEALTHLLLWLVLLVSCACTVVPLVELMVGRSPADVFTDGLAERATRAAARFAGKLPGAVTVSLRELATLASRLGSNAQERLATVVQLEQIASLRSRDRIERPWLVLAARVTPAPGESAHSGTHAAPPDMSDDERLLYLSASSLAERLAEPGPNATHPGTPLPPLPAPSGHVPGLRFAFKATLAAMLCYIIYSGLDWSGIRTSIITCFFVALSSTGETIHKLGLRITGALIGGVLAGISIVFLFPVMDDIGGFVVLFASVTLLCTWVATSSPLLSYAGLQMAFAFYLGVLQDTGPTDDLTVLRDRLVGIVLGNIAMSLVFSTLWPVSAAAAATSVVARVIGQQARLVKASTVPAAADVVSTAVDLEEAARLGQLALFDLGGPSVRPSMVRGLIDPLGHVVGWSNAWLARPPAAAVANHVARRMEQIAHRLREGDGGNPADVAFTYLGIPESMAKALDEIDQETTRAH